MLAATAASAVSKVMPRRSPEKGCRGTRVEDDADSAELSQSREHRTRTLAAENDRGGARCLAAIETGRCRHEDVDERLDSRPALRLSRQLGAHGLPRLADRPVQIAHAGVQVVRNLELFQRLPAAPQPGEPPPLGEVHLRGPESRAVERELRVAIVRPPCSARV